MPLFSKKLKCFHCEGNFKRRRNNKTNYVWICSRRENGYTNCPRVQIDESFLISVIQKRYLIRWGNEIPMDEIPKKVEYIKVEDKLLFEIKLVDFEDKIIYGRNKIIF